MRPILVLALVTGAAVLSPAQPSNSPAPPSVDQESNPRVTELRALCLALQQNYPMLEFAGWQSSWQQPFETRIRATTSANDAYDLMDELVCRLNDYHTRLSWPGKPRLGSPACLFEPVLTSASPSNPHGIWAELRPPLDAPPLPGIAIAVSQSTTNCPLQIGDEIVRVDGAPVEQAFATAWKHAVGCSVAGKARMAAWRMMAGPPDRELVLGIRRGDSETAIKVSRVLSVNEPTISVREVNGVPVIRITRWGGKDLVAQFDQQLAELRNRPGLIIDVRGNGGGSDDLASQIIGRFIRQRIISSISFHRQVPGLNFERTIEYTEPRGPWRYEGRVAVLMDEGCMSACEHFVSGMIEAGALTCGTPTSGACGWIRGVDLGAGLRLNVSQTFPLHTAGIPSPQLGIAPHLWTPRTLADLRSGKDTALLAALDWLNSGKSLPPRLQPMAPFAQQSIGAR